ncbi:aminodeoxychorismate synthase component I [Photobacterium lutimaris]|uniref:aminodeoxychorismate synthase n=1 Tax=Photobacterium lutimaris TaxID=388278 RepID=A0A2T3J221_9GAMM|nr:aminodeoxychorismate synthase component I [Photobacterium lutimaris]PSU35135.1 aminodeoxychorismate synthase, component I [Photobacterium lutimaris]TDR77497.1 aminodeoxychorismate synthase subunit I [Photobacterium lutimaris]
MICKSHPELSIEQLDYHKNASLAWFESLAGQPWAMILRSAASDHPDNRFDILVADPLATLETYGETTRINFSNGDEKSSSDDPFALLQALQAQLLPSTTPLKDVPFIGGAVGLFSYDLGRRVEKIATTAQHDIATADMAVGIYDWALIADHLTEQLYLVSQEGSDRMQWLQHHRHCAEQTTAATNLQHPAAFALTSPWQANMDKDEYCTKFDRIQQYLLSGDCYQINLTQRFSARYQGDEWQAYRLLEERNGAPFSGFLRTSDSAILSVSPERFLQHREGHIVTKPIKGTRPRDADPCHDRWLADDLRSADKDRSENLMIVDLLRNDIGRVAKPGTVKVPSLFDIESFPAVHHLVSTVTGELDQQYTATDLLRACFPGGSITGAPKVRAMEIIEELEPNRRSAYCGSIGYISRCGQMDTSITIRTLVASNQSLHVWAGGGIVADSQADSEYQETLDKLSRILPVLQN